MKLLKYVLISLCLVGILLPANANYWDDAPTVCRQPSQINMSSTSAMRLSGSTLPQAAVLGAYTTYDTQATISGPRRIGGGNSGGGNGPTNPDDVWGTPTPIGDIPWLPILLLLGADVIYTYRRHRVSKD